LISKGVSIDLKNNALDTPLFVAIRFSQYDWVIALLQERANVNEIGRAGETVLHVAARLSRGAREMVKLLLSSGARPVSSDDGVPSKLASDAEVRQLLATAEAEVQLVRSFDELIETEAEYNRNLRTLVEVFVIPTQQRQLLRPEQLVAIFANAIELYNVESNFLAHLKECTTVDAIADLFIYWCTDIERVYSVFCGNYSKAIEILTSITGDTWEYEGFNALLTQAKAMKECNTWSLETFLIKPSRCS
jgi:hypothetical protein